MKQVSTKSEDSASVAEPPPPPAPRRGGRTYEEIEAVNSKQRKVKLAVGTVGLVVSLYVVVTVFQALVMLGWMFLRGQRAEIARMARAWRVAALRAC